MVAVPDASDGEDRGARLARCAAARRPYLRGSSWFPWAANNPGAYVALYVLVALGIVFVATVVTTITGTEPDRQMLPAMGILFGVALAVFVALHYRARARRGALARAMNELAGGLGGRWEGGFEVVVGWLDALWPVDTDPDDLHFASLAHAVVGTTRDRRFLVDVQPDGISSDEGTTAPRVLVYIAAPGVAPPVGEPPGEPPGEIIRRLEEAGFTVEIHPGAGVLARASQALVKRLRKDPSGLVGLTATVLDLVELASALGDATAPAPPGVGAFVRGPGGSRRRHIAALTAVAIVALAGVGWYVASERNHIRAANAARAEHEAAEASRAASVAARERAAREAVKPRDEAAKLPPLTEAQVARGMNAAAANASDCVRRDRGPTTMVMMEVSPAGKVTNVQVFGKLSGTPTGVCMQRALLAATFPPSSGMTFEWPLRPR